MKRFFIALAAASVAMLFSCDKVSHVSSYDEDEAYVEARFCDSSVETKTSISEMVGSTVKFTWLSGDAINVFFGASESSVFVTNTTGRVAQFKGTIGAVTGGGDDLNDETSLWGIYPYDENNTCDGSSVTISLPHIQEANADNLADDLFPSVARSQNFTMSFYPVCGSFRFKVFNPDIVKVTLSGNNNENLAGKAKVNMALGGTPEVSEISEGQKELVMEAPDGGCFEPGKYYYFVLYPSDLSQGYTLTYYKKDRKDSFIKHESYPIGRNKFGGKTEGDKGLGFETSWGEEGQNIVFADAVMKEMCVNAFDTNYDGELSYREAAAVTDLSKMKLTKKSFKTFDEFQYFTEVTTIPDKYFEQIGIKTIILPESVKSIGYSVFEDCTSLSSISIPKSVKSIGPSAFSGCTALSSVTIPESITEIGTRVFHSCI